MVSAMPPAARWLASLAPPRSEPTIGRPSRSPASARTAAVAARASMPGQARTIVHSSLTSSCSAGTAPSTGSKASSRSARRSQTSSPFAGTTLKASPERRIVGTAVSRSGPAGSLWAATLCAAAASASSALRPSSGAEPECDERPYASTRSVAAAFRFTMTASAPPASRWPASKHRQASKSAKRPACTNGAVRHSSSFTSSTAASAYSCGRSASSRIRASASATPPFMSTAPDPVRRSPSRASGRCAS